MYIEIYVKEVDHRNIILATHWSPIIGGGLDKHSIFRQWSTM